jgi:hypothetical protein
MRKAINGKGYHFVMYYKMWAYNVTVVKGLPVFAAELSTPSFAL